MFEQLDHVNIVVRDLPGMIAFYRDLLGLKVVKEVRIAGPWIQSVVGLPDVDADVVYLECPAGGTRIELIHYRSPAYTAQSQLPGDPHAPGIRHLAFRVSGIDTLAGRLRAAGVPFFSNVQSVPDQQVTYAGGARKFLAYFRDPEGNILELCEYRAPDVKLTSPRTQP